MITFNATQQTILSSISKKVNWLFEVTEGGVGPTTYYWSTKAKTFGGQAYTFKIIPESFDGITENRARSEMGIQGPTDLKFTVSNKNNTLLPADFKGGTVLVKKVLKAGANEAVTRSWRFKIDTCQNIRQRLEFTCIDFLQYAIRDSYYPRTPLVKDTFLSKNTDQETNVCVPLPFGTCYVPLRAVYADSALCYLIGPSGVAYTIIEVRSPRSWGEKSIWTTADYTISSAVKADPLARNWTVIYPKIARSRAALSEPDCTGIWQEGERFLDILTKFSRSDLAAKTDPGDVIAYALSDVTNGMGLVAGDLNAAAFAAASAIYAGWGLTWGGALWRHEQSETALSRLLSMCHSVIDVGADLSLRVLSKTSQATITKAVVLGERGKPEFTMTATSKRNADGGYVAWQEAGEAQDEFYKTLIGSATTGVSPNKVAVTPTRPGSETMECPWVNNSVLAQKLAILRFQRIYFPTGECGFQTKLGIAGTYLEGLQTSDVATINEADWGGTYPVLIDRVKHKSNGILEFSCLPLSDNLDDLTDLAPSALVYTEPTANNTWQGATTGPTVPSGMMPNEAKGDLILKAGANIILDGGAIKNNSRATDFEISEDVGIMGKGIGIKMASLITEYGSAPIRWFSEASFEEVVVTAPFAPPSKTQFYSDAFKQNITGNLTVTAVIDLGETWKITFTGAALTTDRQVGNLIEPDWSTPWVKYMTIVANGTDWVEVLKTNPPLFTAPVATNTFSIHGIYANTIMTWLQPYALWFTAGGNVGEGSALATGGSAVDRATGLVTLSTAMPNNIAAGDRLKAYDYRVLFEYGWNNSRVILAPSSRCPDALYLYIGAGGTHPGTQWKKVFMRATDGIDICPAFGATAKKVRVINQNDSWPADLEVYRGNLTIPLGSIGVMSGLATPAPVAGLALIYVDSEYKGVRVILPDGTVKTLVSDDHPTENSYEIITY